jgi:hypothetical protein
MAQFRLARLKVLNRSPGVLKQALPSTGSVVVILFCLALVTGCALSPPPPLSVQQTSLPELADSAIFSIQVHPAPGRTGVLRGYEREFVRQLNERGYKAVKEGGDLGISLRLQRTGWVHDLAKPIESGRLVFRMTANGETVRVGRSAPLSSNDLDFPRKDARVERVRLFLQDL